MMISKFVACVEIKKSNRIEYVELSAKNFKDAIIEVDAMFNDDIYLVDIFEKCGYEKDFDTKVYKYGFRIRRRSHGYVNEIPGYSVSRCVVGKCSWYEMLLGV